MNSVTIQRVPLNDPVVLRPVANGPPPRRAAPPSPQCVHLGSPTGDVFPPLGGGDLIERRLAKLGITKARWGELKHAATLGLAGKGCGGCNWRQKAANWITSHFGMNLTPADEAVVAELLDLEAGQRLPVRDCAIHGECLAQPLPAAALEGTPMICTRCKRDNLGYQQKEP